MDKKKRETGDKKPMKRTRTQNRTLEVTRSKTSELQIISPSVPPQPTGPAAQLPEKATEAKQEGAMVYEAFRTTNVNLLLTLLQQTKHAAPYGSPEAEMTHFYAIAAVHSFGARDGLETFLAVQMVGVHNSAMACLANAADKEQTDTGVEVYLSRANRLIRTFTMQMEALKKYRSNGEQRCTVEHVHVHNGGQAVVGTINQGNVRADKGDDVEPRGGKKDGDK